MTMRRKIPPPHSQIRGPRRGWFEVHAPAVLLTPTIFVLLALTIFPFFYSLALSFHKWNMMENVGWKFIGLQNYGRMLLQDSLFWSAVRVSIIYLTITVSAQFTFGLVVALLLNRDLRATGVIRTIVVLPMMATPVAVGLIWRFMYNTDLGMINYLLSVIGINRLDWLGNVKTGFWAVVIVDVWQWTPFMSLILLAALQALPHDLYEAASIEGARWLQAFRLITLPLIRPAVLVALLIRIMDSFKTFDLIFVLTGGGPGATTQVLSMYTYKVGFRQFEMGQASALSFFMLIIVLVIANIFLKMMNGREKPVGKSGA
jgi:multiple sugar transport system permease protein